MSLPKNLKVIGDQAFAGAPCKAAILPQGVTEIGAGAFMDSALKRVYLPDSIQTIGKGAFSGCDGMTAYVVPGSAASLWCKKTGIKAVELSQIPPIWVTGIALNASAITLNAGDTYALTAKVTPQNATAGVIWTSGAPSIAAVSDDGHVTAVASGKTSIVCEAADGSGVVAMCRVTVSSKSNYRALLIGEVGYSAQLKSPDNDVKAMKAMLTGLDMGYKVTSQIDATKAEIIDLIDLAFGNQGPDDISLFYYSGHGVTNSTAYYSGALMTVDVDYISTDELADMLNAIKGSVIVILDSCDSGAAIMKKGANSLGFDPDQFNAGVISAFQSVALSQPKSGELRQPKFIVITGSAYEEDAQTTNSNGIWGSLMTKAIIAGNGFNYLSSLFSGDAPADSDANGIVTLSECQRYCQSRIGDRQHIQAWPEASDAALWHMP